MSYHSVLGRYELIGQLATGGMAEIHLARLAGEAGFEKIVVVKKLLPELVASKAFVTMFLDEAKLVARLDHPNVCEVYELGKDGAEYFIVMPYLDGIPANELRTTPRVAAGVIVQACAGLHYAHGLEIVHRDVSPSNLFVTTAGIVKVLDFGVAKVPGANATEAGTIKGKTQYMAPEQLLGQPLDRRCDVFALGVVLWELVKHRRLFARDSDYLTARAILEEPIPRADAAAPTGSGATSSATGSAAASSATDAYDVSVPSALADVIERALSRDRNARYADARELGRAIEAAMAEHGGIASSEDIAAALRASHGPALAAQRTRQHDLVEVARSHAGPTPTAAGSRVADRSGIADGSRVAPAASVSGPAANVAGARVAPAPDDAATPRVASGSQVVTAPRAAAILAAPHADVDAADARPTNRNRLRLAVFFAALAGVIVLALASQMRRGSSPSDVSETAVRGSDTTVRGSDVATGGADTAVRPADVAVRGSDDNVRRSDDIVRGSDDIVGSSDGASKPRPSVGRPSDIRHQADPRAKEAGTFSIDSTPFAKILVDGHEFGVTPLIHRSLPAGHHKLHAVLADGRSRDLEVDIPAGKAASPIRLSW